MTAISFFICIATAVATIVAMILQAVELHRQERRTVEDSLKTMRRIMEAITKLPLLPVEKRISARRAITRDILVDAGFVFSMVAQCLYDEPSKDEEVRERTADVVREITHLQWELRKSLFLFRFRPKLVADCQRTLEAARCHCRVWMAYIRLMKAKYPDRYADVAVPDVF